MIEMHKICVFTGSRADYGLLKPLLTKLNDDSEIELKLIVSGSHLEQQFGNTFSEIEKDGFKNFAKLPIPLDGDNSQLMAKSTGAAIGIYADYLSFQKPELLVVLGDRFEALAITIAAYFQKIPIAHISGGDVTEGAIDNAIRHSITQMSHLHFPGCEDSAKRIIQMGESPDRVFNVGEPGIENCLNTEFLSRKQLAETIPEGIIRGKFAVVTFHPVTLEKESPTNQLLELIKSLDNFKELGYVITLANADAGSRQINRLWAEESSKRKNWFVTPSLGAVKYLSALKESEFVLGNSSSGIIEAPSLGIPTINIGNRQKGRIAAKSVINCDPHQASISAAIKLALSKEFKETAKSVNSPFGNGTTSQQILSHIKNFFNKPQNTEKKFFDINFTLTRNQI